MSGFQKVSVLTALLAACGSEPASNSERHEPHGHYEVDEDSGEVRARIGVGERAVRMRSGSTVPVNLPAGLTVFPGADIIRHSRVELEGKVFSIVEFQTAEPVAKVLLFHREQVAAAGIPIHVDINGDDVASIAGTGPKFEYALTARSVTEGTRAQLSVGPASQLATPAARD